MKKLLFSILTIGMSLTGCTDWDDAVTENYGAGPEISVSVAATADNSFSFTLTPSNGTQFYSYVVGKGSEASELDGYSLLKQQYSGVDGGLLNATENATATIEVEASPNTSYVVYAVAANDKGIVGNVTSQVVKTTDSGIPAPASAKAVEGEVAVQVAFSENIVRGEGAVTAQYFVEWTGEFVDIAAENISVAVSGNVATFKFANVPASATVLVSWAEGAFVDYAGNKCKAFNSGLNSAGTAFAGVYFNVADVPFDIDVENITSPEVGGSFQDAANTIFTFTFDMNVYRNTKLLNGGEIKVHYSHSGKTTTVDVPTNYWTTKGNTVLVMLPEEPAYGDKVSLEISEGIIFDQYGNPNRGVFFTDCWLYSYGYKREMILGNYTLSYMSALDGETYTENIVIAEDPEDENNVLLSGFFAEGSLPVKGVFNGDFATLTIKEQALYPAYGNKYDITIAGYNGSPCDIVLNVDANGNLSMSGYGITYWAYGAGTTDLAGYFEVTYSPTFTKQTVAARSLIWNANTTKNFASKGTSFVK